MKIKHLYWILIILGFVVFSLGTVLLVTRVFLDVTWWVFITFILIYMVGGLIYGVIKLILLIRKKPIPQSQIDPDDAEVRARMELLYTCFNP